MLFIWKIFIYPSETLDMLHIADNGNKRETVHAARTAASTEKSLLL